MLRWPLVLAFALTCSTGLFADAQGPSPAPSPSPAASAEPGPATPDDALEALIAGNLRFVAGKPIRQHESSQWRASLTKAQHPFATILACSDSRVPVELLFDQGFGDLFTVRVAGNVATPATSGSILYAVHHLHTQVLLVMGHESCGAVTAALKFDELKGKEPKAILDLLEMITPSLSGVDRKEPSAQQLFDGVKANVRNSIRLLRTVPELAEAEKSGSLKIVGGVYELSTGKLVRVLDQAPTK